MRWGHETQAGQESPDLPFNQSCILLAVHSLVYVGHMFPQLSFRKGGLTHSLMGKGLAFWPLCTRPCRGDILFANIGSPFFTGSWQMGDESSGSNWFPVASMYGMVQYSAPCMMQSRLNRIPPRSLQCGSPPPHARRTLVGLFCIQYCLSLYPHADLRRPQLKTPPFDHSRLAPRIRLASGGCSRSGDRLASCRLGAAAVAP